MNRNGIFPEVLCVGDEAQRFPIHEKEDRNSVQRIVFPLFDFIDFIRLIINIARGTTDPAHSSAIPHICYFLYTGKIFQAKILHPKARKLRQIEFRDKIA